MSNKPEHTADISAELRTLSRGAKQYGLQPTVYGKPIAQYLAELADRIDAAHKRERGDCAKLREALKPVKRYLNGYTVNILELRRTVDAALTAPARNCDRFGGDIEKLREVCLRERGLNPDEDFPEIFCEWLLAAAKKGGAQ